MSLEWIAGAAAIAAGSFVVGLAGFGIGLVSLAFVNQAVILAGYWWAGLLTREVWHLAAVFALPALAGVVTGMALFDRVDPVRFRRIVCGVLFASGAVLLLGG